VTVFGACLQLIRENLKTFSAMVVADPLFQVDTLLAAPDVILHPTTNDVFKLVMQCVRDCVEGYDRFLHLRGVCFLLLALWTVVILHLSFCITDFLSRIAPDGTLSLKKKIDITCVEYKQHCCASSLVNSEMVDHSHVYHLSM